MNNQARFVCLWYCVLPDFVVQINIFFSLVQMKRGEVHIGKTTKYVLDSSLKIKFAFFYPKDIQNIFGKLSILSKIWK